MLVRPPISISKEQSSRTLSAVVLALIGREWGESNLSSVTAPVILQSWRANETRTSYNQTKASLTQLESGVEQKEPRGPRGARGKKRERLYGREVQHSLHPSLSQCSPCSPWFGLL